MHPAVPLSLYIHLPWCVRKCPYCDFNSHTLREGIQGNEQRPSLSPAIEQAYIAALLADLDADLAQWPELHQRSIGSIFFGGGTPSLMSPAGYTALFTGLGQRLAWSPSCEVTLEANPSSVEQARFEGYRAAGINRLSLGVQSFQDHQLSLLGRVHSGSQAIHALEAAQQAGFTRINIDLMHGLPEQTPESACADLEQALAWASGHLSWYQLTIEPNTLFYRQPPSLPAEDTLYAIQEAGQALITEAGYEHYEVSAYAQPQQQARHNINYWTFGDYLGLGAGAHGKLSRIHASGEHWIERRWKVRQPDAYLARAQQAVNFGGSTAHPFLAGQEQILPAQRPLEFMMNALRLAQGVPAALYTQRTGLPLSDLMPAIHQLQQRELWTTDPKRLACSALGWRWLNTVLESFFAE